jgi:hypothetical protein
MLANMCIVWAQGYPIVMYDVVCKEGVGRHVGAACGRPVIPWRGFDLPVSLIEHDLATLSP